MAAKLERSSRKGNLRLKDDLHVKINEAAPAALPSAPGEGGVMCTELFAPKEP